MSVAAVVVAALAVAIPLVTLGFIQGGPGDASGGAIIADIHSVPAAQVAAYDPAAGDRVVVVVAGDSLWSIASEAAPGRDPRPLVAALTEANGGTSLQIGQQIVIPGHLLD